MEREKEGDEGLGEAIGGGERELESERERGHDTYQNVTEFDNILIASNS